MLGQFAARLLFDWFAPPCPVDTGTKTWVERRMIWLADRFGVDRLRNAPIILPTDEFFPDPYTPDDDGCRACLKRLCSYMGVDRRSVRLNIVDDDMLPDTAGLFQLREQSIISVARSQLDDPMSLMATVAHELAHELLLKGGHLTGYEPDHEQITDLLPVFLGLGVFAANATVRTRTWSEGRMSYSSFSKQGYLSSIELGYALAAFAFFRDEHRPRWAKHLRPDAACTLRDGLRYLHRTGNTLFHPDTYFPRRAAATGPELESQLADTRATVRLNALWDLAESTAPPSADLLPAVERCLEDPNPTVQLNAVTVLGRFGTAAAETIPRLIEAAYSNPASELRAAATTTLSQVGTDSAEIVPVLITVLRDDEAFVVCAAAAALARYGPAAEPAVPKLLDVLEAAGSVADHDRIAQMVATLCTISPNARDRIRAHFAHADPEIRRNVLEELIRQDQN